MPLYGSKASAAAPPSCQPRRVTPAANLEAPHHPPHDRLLMAFAAAGRVTRSLHATDVPQHQSRGAPAASVRACSERGGLQRTLPRCGVRWLYGWRRASGQTPGLKPHASRLHDHSDVPANGLLALNGWRLTRRAGMR